MKNLKVLFMIMLFVCFTSKVAMAEESKAYAVVDYGQGSAPDACNGLPSNFSCTSTTTAYRLGLGYQVDKNVGLEAAYINAGKVTATGVYSGVPMTLDATVTGFQFSAIGAYQIANEVALLGKAGLALVTGKASGSAPGVYVTSDQSNTNFTYGFGARFTASQKLAFRIMFEDFGSIKTSSTSSGSKVTVLSVGLQIGF